MFTRAYRGARSLASTSANAMYTSASTIYTSANAIYTNVSAIYKLANECYTCISLYIHILVAALAASAPPLAIALAGTRATHGILTPLPDTAKRSLTRIPNSECKHAAVGALALLHLIVTCYNRLSTTIL